MTIDVHGHIGRCGAAESTPAALEAWAGRHAVDVVLVSNVAGAAARGTADDRDEVDANLACLEAAAAAPRFRPLYWVRPGRRDSNVSALFGALVSEPFAGAVFAPVWNDFPADSALLDPYLEVLTRLHLPAFIQTARDDRATPERIYTLARRHAGARIVLYDALSDAHREDSIRVAQRCAQRGDARVLLDTANADAAAVLTAVGKAGAGCVIYGSAACLGNPTAGRAGPALTPETLRAQLSAAEFERVTRANALALFESAAEPAPSADA